MNANEAPEGAPHGSAARPDRDKRTTGNRRQRDTYAEVGRAMRHSIERGARADLGQRDRRVHAAVLALTASWSRLSDETSLQQVAAIAYGIERDAVTGWHRTKVGESLRKLSELGIVAYAAGRGPGARCTVEIATAPCDGVPFEETEKHPATGCDSERHPAVARKAPYGGAERHPAVVTTPRSTSEKKPEPGSCAACGELNFLSGTGRIECACDRQRARDAAAEAL